jgi:hypothetical protein
VGGWLVGGVDGEVLRWVGWWVQLLVQGMGFGMIRQLPRAMGSVALAGSLQAAVTRGNG